MTTLQSGSTGSDVMQLQNALNALGYGITVDGNFGTSTKAAVMHFQSTNGLTIDGVVGPETFNGIKAAVSGQPVTPSPATVRAAAPRPAGGGVLVPKAGGVIMESVSGYQNLILYGAVGFVAVLVILRLRK